MYDVASRRLRLHGEERRNVIMSLIQSHIGIRYSELTRRTSLAHGTLTHHINILERQKRMWELLVEVREKD